MGCAVFCRYASTSAKPAARAAAESGFGKRTAALRPIRHKNIRLLTLKKCVHKNFILERLDFLRGSDYNMFSTQEKRVLNIIKKRIY